MKILNEHIKEKRFKPVYLLCGKEGYLKRQYRDRLKEAILDGDDMNYSRFESAKMNVLECIDICETLPFFSEKRVVVIENTGFFKKACDDALINYIKNMPEYLHIIFVESEIDKRSKLYKAVASAGYVSELDMQDERMLAQWVSKLATDAKKSFDKGALRQFVAQTGGSMDNMKMELDKLICFCEERPVITEEDVRQICTVRTENRIFDLIASVGMKNRKKAMELYYDLRTLREPPLRILALMGRQFNMLYQASLLSKEGYDSSTIAKKMGVMQFVAGKYLEQAKNYEITDIKSAMEDCAAAEEAVKTGRLGDVLSIEMLIIKYSSREEVK